jgi:PST family polysaccharide transporter
MARRLPSWDASSRPNSLAYEPRHSKATIERNRIRASEITARIELVPIDAEGPGLGRRVGTSAMWSALNAGLLRASTFLVSLLVAHLVVPYEFGVFTVAFTIMSFALSLPELGVSSAIVREHDRSREIAPTVFTISLLGGGLLAGVMVLFAPFFASELGAPAAAGAVRVLAIIPLLSGLSVVPAALMSRDFMQRQRFITDAAFFGVSTATMLVLVLLGHPILGLAWGQVSGHVVSITLLMLMAPEKYWPGMRRREAKRLLGFGLPLAGANLLTMAIANVDFVVVGHWLGPQRLGYYNLAFSIVGWPVTIFSAVLISVTLPTLSRVRHDGAELTRHVRAGLSAVVAGSFPAYALLCALSGALIDVVYGSRWHAAWSALVVLGIFGVTRTVLLMLSDLAVALGLTRRLLYIQLAWFACLVPTMIACVTRWGILGAGIAHALVVTLIVLPMYLFTVHRQTPVPLASLKFVLGRPLVGSVGAAAAAYGGAALVQGDAAKLLVGLACGLAAYALLAGPWMLRVGRLLIAMYWRDHSGAAPAQAPSTSLPAEPLVASHG